MLVSSTVTTPGKLTEPPLTTDTPKTDRKEYTVPLEWTTENPVEKLQKLAQGLDQSFPEVVGPDDILEVTTNIKEIINAGDASESEMLPSVLQTTAKITENLASAARGLQGVSGEKMETIADALVQTASAVVDMLPEPETQTVNYSDNLFESDVIDMSDPDVSPKQQLKMLKEKQEEKQSMQQKASQSIVASLDQVADTLLALQPEGGEYHSRFETKSVSVDVARSPSDKDLLLSSSDVVANILSTQTGTQTHRMQDVKVAVFKRNPYSWSESTGGQNISSSVTFLTVDSKEPGSHRKNREVELDMPFVPFQETVQPADRPHVTTETPSTAEGNSNGTAMVYHAFSVPQDNVIPVVHMKWWDVEAIFHVYISYGSLPTAELFSEKIVIQKNDYESWLKGTNFSTSFIPNTTNHGGLLYIGVQKLGPANSGSGQQPVAQIQDKKDYQLSFSAVGCSSWKDNKKQWMMEDCNATINLENGAINCRCHMSEWKVSVGTMTLPVPNSINLINAFQNFLHLSDNSVVFSIVVSETILYLLLMVLLCVDFHRLWKARRFTSRISPTSGVIGEANNQSKRLSKVSLIPPDRMPAPHVYQLTVTTGSMFGAGTTSRIGLQLFGSEATSPVKMLNPGGEELVRGSTLHFVMPVRESLGEVMLLHIWHDNSGEGDTASWFLGSFVVRDVEKDVVSYFICNDWLSTEKGDGEVQKVVHSSTEAELTSFTNVFNEATRDVLYDKQLWASVIVAAPGSSFTKAQRLSCCFTLVNTMMLASAMWYKAENTTANARVFNLGFVRFTVEELYISFMTMLTVLPVNVMLLQLFRMGAPLSVNTPEMTIRPSKQGYLRRTLFRLAKYVAWVTVFLVSTSSAFFVLLYSMDWGKEKSDAWMKAFVLSFIGSSCVVDTLQIFVLSVALAAIFSLPFLTNPAAIRKEDLQLDLWNSTAPKKIYAPVKPDGQSARKKKELGKKSASVLKEFLLLLVFVVLLFYIAQADKDQHAFYERQSLSNSILQEYDAIKTPDQFYSWLEDVWMPTLYPTTWYNGKNMKYLDRQFAHNTGSFRVGPPRLTQIRQLPDTMARTSSDELGWSFLQGNGSGNCWRFRIRDQLTQPNDINRCTTRHSFDVPVDHGSTVSFLSALRDNEFFDKYTRSVALDINFYNPSLKLFSVVNMILDRSGVGHLVPTSTITSFKLFQYETDADYVDLFMHILFTLIFLVVLFREVKGMKDMGWKYFTSKWNVLGCVSLIGTATVISVFIKRYVVASETLTMVATSNGDLGFVRFLDLTAALWWDACFKHALGLVVFINTITLLRVVRFSQTVGKLLAIPGIMKEELLSFLVVAAVAFMAFVSSGHLIFGSHMESYTDLYHTMFALFEMMLGRFFAQDMVDSNPLTGPIFFSSFMICIFILLMNFLMTIVCDAISADVDVTHDSELAEYIWRSFRAMLGLHSTPDKEDKPGVLKMEELKANICMIRDKLDQSLDICNSILPLSSRQQKSSPTSDVLNLLKNGRFNASYKVICREHKLAPIDEEDEFAIMDVQAVALTSVNPDNVNVKDFDIDTEIQTLMQEYEKEEKSDQQMAENKLLTEVRVQTKKIADILSRMNRSTAEAGVKEVSQCAQVAAAPYEKHHTMSGTQGSAQCPSRNMWISDLRLTAEDKAVLLSDEVLTDKHIHAAQMLLRRQYPGLGGLQDTAVGASSYGYTRVSGEGLQIHHTGQFHWVVSSSIGGHVSVYNSIPSGINDSLEYQLCQCYPPVSNLDTDVLIVKVPRVQLQSSSSTCGLFAIAWAVDIAMGTDVAQVWYDESKMRAHLLDCFKRRHLTPFPRVRWIPSGRSISDHRITLVCRCRRGFAGERLGGLIKCKKCHQVFHMACCLIEERRKKKYTCGRCSGHRN
ncbi:polycystin-1-like protein 2 [Branchiostoma floridae x Branchiostoma belcheri]